MNQQKSFMDNFFLKKIIQQKKKRKIEAAIAALSTH